MTTDAESGNVRDRLRIPLSRLTTRVDEAQLAFETTREVSPLESAIGQERALEALAFGLGVDSPGFNVYVAGQPGSGRMTTVTSYLGREAAKRPVPNDWVYVYNFQDPMKPRGVSLPPGYGRRFAEDVREMVAELRTRLPRAFESPDYQERVEAALESVHRRHKELTEEMVAEARRHGVGLALTEAGITATPLGPNGEPMTPEEVSQLPGEEAERLQRGQQAVQEFVTGRVAVLRQLEREAAQARLQVNRDVGNFVMQPLFAELHEKYATVEPEAGVHLDDLTEDMLRNLPLFLQHEQDGQAGPQDPFAGAAGDDDLGRYRVNVFTDRSRASGAPVVFEATPTYNNVFGSVQHRLRQGVMSADFMMAHPGAIHRANGGFLVLQAKDVLAYPFVWQALKEALRSGQAAIENLAGQFSSVPASTIEPEPIPLDVKVVLIGNPQLARMLMLHDEDFPKLFKVKADFAYEVDLKPENITKHAQFVAAQVQEHNLPHFDAAAVARLIEQSSRLVEDQGKLTARFADVADLVTEASYWARAAGRNLVGGDDVLTAASARRRRSNLVEDRFQELFEDGTVRIDVTGSAVGQINGLAVIDMGDYSFGRPSRLTARVSLGRGEFGNVEQASQMSGRIHSKGFQILIGYLMGKYGVESTLPVRISIAFEQTYEDVDGDSASSTELYALLSGLSGLPINQGLAVTGSLDQQGRVQAIGGATRKIEGFFEVCKARGLTGSQGVLVPASNVRNLVLKREVVDAVDAGRFSVYAVESVEQGIELLTGVPAGEPDENGDYPAGTVNALVMAALAQMTERLQNPERSYRAPRDPAASIATEDASRPERDPREGPGVPPSPPLD